MNKYGKAPVNLGHINLELPEVMYYLYLPIKFQGQGKMFLEQRLWPLFPLLNAIRNDVGERAWFDNYVYVTVKKMFVSPQVTANRPGWHADGFGTNDLNYIWYDELPTLFAEGEDFHITEGDHIKSLEEFERDANSPANKIVTYQPKTLLKLDPYVVHAVDTNVKEQIMRTFVKVSISRDRYNLKDNSINPLLPTRWKMYDRANVRNDPNQAQKDSYTPPEDDHFA